MAMPKADVLVRGGLLVIGLEQGETWRTVSTAISG